jgi:hypothetical protein
MTSTSPAQPATVVAHEPNRPHGMSWSTTAPPQAAHVPSIAGPPPLLNIGGVSPVLAGPPLVIATPSSGPPPGGPPLGPPVGRPPVGPWGPPAGLSALPPGLCMHESMSVPTSRARLNTADIVTGVLYSTPQAQVHHIREHATMSNPIRWQHV